MVVDLIQMKSLSADWIKSKEIGENREFRRYGGKEIRRVDLREDYNPKSIWIAGAINE
jgi:hypothetical protein